MKPRYRKKGNHANGETKIIIEYMEDRKFKSIALPKAAKLLDLLKRPEITTEEVVV